MNHKHFNSSVYTDFVRRKANTQLYKDDLANNIHQSERSSIVSRPPMADIFTSGIFNDFKYLLYDTEPDVEPDKYWYIDTFIGTNGTITTPYNDNLPNIAYSDNKLYYTSAYNVLSVVNLSNNTVTTVAGNGSSGYPSNDSIPATSPLPPITAVTVDTNKNIYIATESGSFCIYMIPFISGTYFQQFMTAGRIYIIVGITWSEARSDVSDTLLGTESYVQVVNSLNVDSGGNLFFNSVQGEDGFDSKIVMMPNTDGIFFGLDMQAGRLYTVAGRKQRAFNGDEISATSANLNKPECVLNDKFGNLIISDSFNGRIRMVPRIEGTYFGVSMPTVGYIYTIVGTGANGLSGDDGSNALSAVIRIPSGLTLDSNGNLYFCDRYNHRVRKVTTDGKIYNIAGISPSGIANGGYEGDDELASQSKLVLPTNIVIKDDDTLYVAESEFAPFTSRIRILNFIPLVQG